MIYLVSFSCSALLAHWANKTKNRRLFILCSIIGMLIPVLMATFRGYSIGVDVNSYRSMEQYWNGAIKADNIFIYLKKYVSSGYREYLFAIFVGIIAKTTENFRVFLFLSHLIIVLGIYIGAFRQRKHVNPALVIMLFYLCYYNQSLNIIRQYIAMAIIFAFFADLEEKKYLRYLIVVAIVTLIHNTAILGVGAWLIHFVMYTEIPKVKCSLLVRKLFISGMLSLSVLGFVPLCKVLIYFGIIGKKYEFYTSGENTTYAILASLLLAMELIAVFVFWKKMKKDCMADFFMMNSCSFFILCQLTAFMPYGKRIASYFCLNNLITIALIEKSQDSKKMRWIVRIMILGIVLAYWLYSYVLRNSSDTYPYTFKNMIFY